MTQTAMVSPSSQTSPNPIIKWVRWFIWEIAIATLLLLAIGCATRVMNAGLACPDWPLCYGQLIPSQQMNLQVFLEWFHRLDAGLIGLSLFGLVSLCWWNRRSLPSWLPWMSLFALGLIVVQAILGALTVTQLLRFDIVTAHLGTALFLFGTLVAMGVAVTPYQGTNSAGKLFVWGGVSSVLVYGQCLLGGLVASRWAVHQCLDSERLCNVMNHHLFGVFPPTIAVLLIVGMIYQTPALTPVLRRLGYSLLGVLGLQVSLGLLTLRWHLQVEPLTVAHHTIGATLLGLLIALTVLAWRDTKDVRKVSPIGS